MSADVQHFEPLVGEWTTKVRMPGSDEVVRGRTTFEWLEGGGYLIQRAVMDDPVFPRGVMVVGPDAGGERVVQHPFDSLRLSADGMTIEGAWEICEDGKTWRHDFELTYMKVT